ncbi:PriCT-2 domain-containing protein [Polaromonas sp. P5_D5]
MTPQVLRALKTWLVWKLEPNPEKPDKPLKVPYYIDGGKRVGVQGSPEDRSRLCTYDDAAAAQLVHGFTGLGLAFIPDCGIVGLDFDHCVGSDGSIDARVQAVIEGTFSDHSPSGTGIHAYFLGSLKSRKDNAGKNDRVGGLPAPSPRLDKKFDVEFFGTNGFLTFTGNETADSALFGHDVVPLTDAALTLYKERFSGAGMALTTTGTAHDLVGVMPRQGWTIEQAREYLNDCDADCNRETWLKVLMALHHEFDGGEDGLDLADEWSATAASYAGRKDVEGRWYSFKQSDREPITGNWLMFWRNEQLKRQKYTAEEEHITVVNATTDIFQLREKVCTDIAKDQRLDDAARGQIAQTIVTQFKALGKKYLIADVRRMLKPARIVTQFNNSSSPHWLEDWLYCTDRDKFYRYDSGEWLSIQGFNTKFTRYMPKDDKNDPIKEAAIASREDFDIETVTKAEYVPWAGRVFDINGVSAVNTYRPSSVPDAVKHQTDSGRKAVEVIRRHLTMMCSGREEVIALLVDWMAHNVQNPGIKIRWAPLIKGIQGDGKTLLGSLLESVMGESNVKNVSSKVLGTDFTSWATGSCIVVLEEVKLTGHNRYDILNAIKPMIANSKIEVHKKGQDADGGAMNVTNYICFTNFVDALPLDDTDRRYMVVFSPFLSVADLVAGIKKATGFSGGADDVLQAYFDELHDAVEAHSGELRRWLLDHKLSASFRPNGRAPMTDEKLAMIGLNVSEDERAVKEAIDAGGEGITADLFSSRKLTTSIQGIDTEWSINTSAGPKIYTKLGFVRFAYKVKWKGESHVIWSKQTCGLTTNAIRVVLDGTLAENARNPPEDCADLFRTEKVPDFGILEPVLEPT